MPLAEEVRALSALRTLALMVFDAVIERMGLAAGARQDEIIGALKPIIVAAEPGADVLRVTEVVTAVLNFLMNEDERRRAFCEEMHVVEGGAQATSAKGIYYFNHYREGAWKLVAKPESEWGKVECEPIIAETLRQQVNQIIKEQSKGWKRPGKAPVQLFGSRLIVPAATSCMSGPSPPSMSAANAATRFPCRIWRPSFSMR